MSNKEKFTVSQMTPETEHVHTGNMTGHHTQQQQHLDPKRVKEDLLALGIDVDYHVIGRMQKLGLNNTWNTTSKAASSLRKRNPYGVPSNVSYQNLDDPDETSHVDNQELGV
jgi:hypothetical protein